MTTAAEALVLVPKLRFPGFLEAGGFKIKKIDQISENVTAGGTPSTSEKEYWGGTIRWMSSGELNYKKVHEVQGRITEKGLQSSSTKIIPKKCVLIGLAGQGKTRGTVAMNMVELCINQSIAAIFPNEEQFSSEFLYHNLDTRYDELRSLSAGGEGRGGLNLQIIKSLRVPLPGLKEQHKIADCLASVDELITLESQKLDCLKLYKKGLMQQLFPTEGETVPRLRFPEFQNESEWSAKNLKNICEVNPANSGLPEKFVYIDLESVEAGKLKLRRIICQEEAPSRAQRLLRYGDVIFQMVRPYQRNNLHFKIKEEMPYVASTGYAQLRANESEDFLFQVIHTNEFIEKVIAKCTGSSYPAINSSDLADLSLAIPQKAEQQKIAECLTSIDDCITVQNQKIETLKTHKKGLMQQLFPAPDGFSAAQAGNT